jgi:hypothetical protein
MIAGAKKCFSKVKEMDDTIVIYPWFKASKNSKVQETGLIPENDHSAYFHQANPRVKGGFVYMRVCWDTTAQQCLKRTYLVDEAATV